MADATRKTRLAPPLMHVFRAAHSAKDAKKVDMRTESGERTIAGRRLPARQVITESELRREVVHDLAALLNTVAMESTVDLSEAAGDSKIDFEFWPSRYFQPHHRCSCNEGATRANQAGNC